MPLCVTAHDEGSLGLISPAELLVEVKAKRKWIQGASPTSSSEISVDQISQLSQGVETSLPRLLAMTMPGIVQGPFGQMFFRGNHANIQYQIDGVQLPDSPSNTFGQAISPRNIERMEVITGGIPAEYGQRLAAVVNIVTRSGKEEGVGELELNYGSYNTFTPHLLYGGSSADGRLHYFFSAQYSRTNRGLDTPEPLSQEDQRQGGADSIHNEATGTSEFLKLDWLADNENKLSLIFSYSQNRYQIPTYPSSFRPTDSFFQTGFTDSFENSRENQPTYNFVPTETQNGQFEVNTYTQAIWKHTFSNRSFFQLVPYYKYSLISVSNDPVHDLSAEQFLGLSNPLNSPGATTAGSTPISQSNPSSFAQNRHTNNFGLKGDYAWRPDDFHFVKWGFQGQASRADGWISIQTDLGTPPIVDSTPNTGFYESVYIQDEISLFKPLVLTAGLRFDATQFSFAGQNPTESLLQPRVGATYLLGEDTKLHVFYGKLFQPASVEALRYQYNGTSGSFVPLQSYDIRAEKDDYYEIGIAQAFYDHLLSTNVYYKNGVDILDDTQLLNTSIAQPYNFATGYAYGVEVSLKGQISSEWADYMNYSYEIATGKGISGGFWTGVTPSDDSQILDHVQKHTANAGIIYSKKNFWWSVQSLYGSGLRTGPNNSLNLPFHITFDSTFGYKTKDLKVSIDVLNLMDNRYPITIANGFNGSHYSAGRQYFFRVTREF